MAQDPERLLALFRTYYDLRDMKPENPAFRDAEHDWYSALRRFLLEAAAFVERQFNVRNRVRADELAEKVLVDVMEKIREGSFKPEQFASSWGLTTFLRRRLRWHANDKVKPEERELTNFQDILDGTPEPEERDTLTILEQAESYLEQAQLVRKLQWALTDIDSEMIATEFFGGHKCGQMIKWHFFDGKTYREIAEELNVSASHVHGMIKRGLKMLPRWLAGM